MVFVFIIPFTVTYWYIMQWSGFREAMAIQHTEKTDTVVTDQATYATVPIHKTGSTSTVAHKTDQPKAGQSSHLYILSKIAYCESHNDPLAANKTSSAKGLLQIIDSTWIAFKCDGDVFNAEDNMRCGLKILTTSGIQHWNPSRACWSKYIDV